MRAPDQRRSESGLRGTLLYLENREEAHAAPFARLA